MDDLPLKTIQDVIQTATTVAKRSRQLTGKPLGITGEIGEVLGADLLGLDLADARQAGYDAISKDGRRVQIKARCILSSSKRSQQVGSIRLDHEWDTVALILMNEDFEALSIYEATRPAIEAALEAPGSKARNERGSLAVSKFKSIATRVWPED